MPQFRYLNRKDTAPTTVRFEGLNSQFFKQSFWRKYAADNDFPATWIPHTTQQKDDSNLLRTPRKSVNHQRSSKPDMFGVPFTPIIPSIHVTRNENGKGMTSPPSKSSHPVSPGLILFTTSIFSRSCPLKDTDR